jgi:hypothetical protein
MQINQRENIKGTHDLFKKGNRGGWNGSALSAQAWGDPFRGGGVSQSGTYPLPWSNHGQIRDRAE